MGIHPNLNHDRYPKQIDDIGVRAIVLFHYDTEHPCPGTVIRDDADEPYRTVIRLDDGRVVLGSECQWAGMGPADMARYPDPRIPVYGQEQTGTWTIVRDPDKDLPPKPAEKPAPYVLLTKDGKIVFANPSWHGSGQFHAWYVRMAVGDAPVTVDNADVVAYRPCGIPAPVQEALRDAGLKDRCSYVSDLI